MEQAFHDYTTEALAGYEKSDIEGLLKDRLKSGKEKLDEVLEAIKALIEPVDPPKNMIDFVHYFCGKDTGNKDEFLQLVVFVHAESLLFEHLVCPLHNGTEHAVDGVQDHRKEEDTETERKGTEQRIDVDGFGTSQGLPYPECHIKERAATDRKSVV